ncbi:MAG TPA: D-alanyl-D-alanine carboxypeptidase family protein [Tissierellaceae bacterium]|nr:D-alanyl-D-alanine carboxypeptidase family protein [Tissierellaceae bacterium]
MRKTLSLLFTFTLLLNVLTPLSPFAADNDLDLDGEAAILMDYDSETILYEKNIHKQLYPASTTKILTGILAIENSDMDEVVTIDEEIVSLTDGSHIALDYDEEVTVEDLLHGLLIASANDAAVALGKHVGGSLDEFIKMMNDKAEELETVDTNFVNPSGLHDDDHVSSAYDLAIIGKYAMENKIFREIVNKPSYEIDSTNKQDEPRKIHSTNKFLYGNNKIEIDGEEIPIRYDGVSGIKTGYTPEAKNCLVTFAEQDGRKLIAVVLKSNNKKVYADTYKLLDHGFNDFTSQPLGHANEFIDNINIDNGELDFVPAILDKDVTHFLSDADVERIEKKVNLNKDLRAPIKQGESIGSLEYYLNEEIIARGNIIATMSVKSIATATFLQTLKDKWYLIILALLIFFRIIYIIRKSNQRKRKGKSLIKYSPNIR